MAQHLAAVKLEVCRKILGFALTRMLKFGFGYRDLVYL